MTGGRVLLIENDSAITEIISYSLAQIGVKVIPGSPEQYKEQIDAIHPDVIILDHWVDLSHDWEISSELKSHPSTKDIPIILTSTSNNIDTIGVRCQVNDTLAKPFNLTDLQQKVSCWLKKTG